MNFQMIKTILRQKKSILETQWNWIKDKKSKWNKNKTYINSLTLFSKAANGSVMHEDLFLFFLNSIDDHLFCVGLFPVNGEFFLPAVAKPLLTGHCRSHFQGPEVVL